MKIDLTQTYRCCKCPVQYHRLELTRHVVESAEQHSDIGPPKFHVLGQLVGLRYATIG